MGCENQKCVLQLIPIPLNLTVCLCCHNIIVVLVVHLTVPHSPLEQHNVFVPAGVCCWLALHKADPSTPIKNLHVLLRHPQATRLDVVGTAGLFFAACSALALHATFGPNTCCLVCALVCRVHVWG